MVWVERLSFFSEAKVLMFMMKDKQRYVDNGGGVGSGSAMILGPFSPRCNRNAV